MRSIDIRDETAPLESVILGTGESMGEHTNNPKALYHKENNTFPKQAHVLQELQVFKETLERQGVEVLRPKNIPDIYQIFTRDIGFVIDDFFVVANMKIATRQAELKGIRAILNTLDPAKLVQPPPAALIEGGDVILWNDYIFVGKSARTNTAGFHFLRDFFKSKTVIQIPTIISPDYRQHILHLDCAFQPVGSDQAIIYQAGFVEPPTPILDLFPADRRIEVTKNEMISMYPNIFSISNNTVIIEQNFTNLKHQLLKRGFQVLEVPYQETSKFSGLLRCSTLPLKRKY